MGVLYPEPPLKFPHQLMTKNSFLVLKRGMDQWMLAVTLAQLLKDQSIGLEVAGYGPVSCHFFIPFSFLPCVVL